MTREELLKEACKRCEEYSVYTNCECVKDCPVYNLFLLAEEPHKTKKVYGKLDDWKGLQGNCDFEPQPKPEMI